MRSARTAVRAVVAPVAARARIRKDGTSPSWTSPSNPSSAVDIAKRTLDVHVLPERTSLKPPNDSKGRGQLREKFPPPGECLIVVEATGGYRAGPRRRTDRRGPSGCGRQPPDKSATSPKPAESSPRPIGSTRPCWHASERSRRAADPDQNPGKTALELQGFLVVRRRLARRAANRRNEPQRKRRQQVLLKSLQESVDALTKQIRRFEKRITALLVQSDDEWKQEGRDCSKRARGLDRARVQP